jgi:hypothetical protein
MALGGEIMQIKSTIAAAAAAFALASVPALAVEMPDYGSKNFTTPGVAPSYFTNESGAISARGPDTAAIPDETDDATASDVPLVNPGTGRHGKHASAGKSGKHASGKSGGHGGLTQYAKASSAKSTAGRSGTQAGAGKTGTTKHAKSGIRQHAAVAPAPETPRASVA